MTLKPRESVVIVCGAPSSGNKLIQALLDRHGLQALVDHGTNGNALWGRVNVQAAIMVVRSLPCWEQSSKRFSDRMKITPHEHLQQCYEGTFKVWIENGCPPLLLLSYESVTEAPDVVAESILNWLGVEPQHESLWPGGPGDTHMKDKRHVGPVFNGNAQYLEPATSGAF